MELNRENTIQPWKVHKFPAMSGYGKPYYIGPKHGRIVVCDYETKAEAAAAIEIKNWMVKFLKVKP